MRDAGVLPYKRSTFQVDEKVNDAATTKAVNREDLRSLAARNPATVAIIVYVVFTITRWGLIRRDESLAFQESQHFKQETREILSAHHVRMVFDGESGDLRPTKLELREVQMANNVVSDVDRDWTKYAVATLPHSHAEEQIAVPETALHMLQRRGAQLRARLSSP
ncbi:hypothetical protein DL770_009913 [Monosporascus sp. CRB-9-2]|nr:hypothetical protein DL770_009913 [Monosporascus sp. CRB-9-2]